MGLCVSLTFGEFTVAAAAAASSRLLWLMYSRKRGKKKKTAQHNSYFLILFALFFSFCLKFSELHFSLFVLNGINVLTLTLVIFGYLC